MVGPLLPLLLLVGSMLHNTAGRGHTHTSQTEQYTRLPPPPHPADPHISTTRRQTGEKTRTTTTRYILSCAYVSMFVCSFVTV